MLTNPPAPIYLTRGLPVPTQAVVYTPPQRRDTSPFPKHTKPDDATRFKAERDAARKLADLDKRKRAARPSNVKRKRTPADPKPWDLERATERYTAGESAARIAPAYGVSRATVVNRLRAAGVEIRPNVAGRSAKQ